MFIEFVEYFNIKYAKYNKTKLNLRIKKNTKHNFLIYHVYDI